MSTSTFETPNLPAVSKAPFWTGWVLSGIVGLLLLVGALNAFHASPQVLEGLTHLGYQRGILPIMGVVELVCVLVYFIPATNILGAILLTAYFGGAVASHLRIGEPQWPFAVLLGVLTWLGLYLRDARLRRLVPFNR